MLNTHADFNSYIINKQCICVYGCQQLICCDCFLKCVRHPRVLGSSPHCYFYATLMTYHIQSTLTSDYIPDDAGQLTRDIG